ATLLGCGPLGIGGRRSDRVGQRADDQDLIPVDGDLWGANKPVIGQCAPDPGRRVVRGRWLVAWPTRPATAPGRLTIKHVPTSRRMCAYDAASAPAYTITPLHSTGWPASGAVPPREESRRGLRHSRTTPFEDHVIRVLPFVGRAGHAPAIVDHGRSSVRKHG